MTVPLILVCMATAQMASTVTLVFVRVDILAITVILVSAYCRYYQQYVVYHQYTNLMNLLVLIKAFHYDFFSLFRTNTPA